jgi:carboxymethylenebutenolidase
LRQPELLATDGRQQSTLGEGVRRFYAGHFVESIPADWSITLISRTVGLEQVVDELVISFTHDVEVDFLLPGVPPTGRHVESPTVAIGAFRDGMVRYEHIYWDQASVLVQVGLLEPRGMPCVGAEQARKLLDDDGPFNACSDLLTEREARTSAPPRPGARDGLVAELTRPTTYQLNARQWR